MSAAAGIVVIEIATPDERRRPCQRHRQHSCHTGADRDDQRVPVGRGDRRRQRVALAYELVRRHARQPQTRHGEERSDHGEREPGDCRYEVPTRAIDARPRTTPTANVAIGPKSGETAIAPTTIGALSSRIAIAAITPDSTNSASRPQPIRPSDHRPRRRRSPRSLRPPENPVRAARPRRARVDRLASTRSMSIVPTSGIPRSRRSAMTTLASSSADVARQTSPADRSPRRDAAPGWSRCPRA